MTMLEGNHGRRRGLLMQVITTLAMAMHYLTTGASVAFSGVFIEQLTSEGADINLTTSEISWVASIVSIGNTLGYLASSYVNPLLGAIRVCQMCAPLVAAGFLMIAFGNNFWILLAGRLLSGIASGIMTAPINTHIGEISSVHARGILTTTMITIAVLGITCAYLTGWLLGWRYMCLVMGITPMVLMFVITLMLPNSARWIISKGHPVEEAERSLRFYFGSGYDADKEIKDIKESLGDGHQHDANIFQVLGRLKHRYNYIPFMLILCLYFLMVFSGGNTTTTFAPVIFRDVGGFDNPYMGSILVGVVRLIGTVLCSTIMNRLHRRTLPMVNGAVGGAGCLITGCYFFYKDQLSDYAWVSLVSVLVIVFFMSIGISPLKTVLFGELLPNSIRSELSGICLVIFGVSNFITVYTFPLVVSAIGMSGIYWFFTLMHVLIFVFSMFCLPDTRGKSIEEIQMLFVKSVANTVGDPVHIHVEERRGSLSVKTFESGNPDEGIPPLSEKS